MLGDGVSERQDSWTAGFGRDTDDAGTPVMLVFAIQHIERAVTRGTYSAQFPDNSFTQCFKIRQGAYFMGKTSNRIQKLNRRRRRV